MRAAWFAVVVLVGCGPKVDPQSPFDEDDPRAGGLIDAAPAPPPPETDAPPPPPAPTVREGTFTRAAVKARLDAQPGALLKCLEVAAVDEGGKFGGWRLVRFVRGCDAFDGLDLAVDDVLVSINGRVLVKPADLSDLWTELYGASEITAELRRGGQPVQLHFAITP